MTSTRSSPIPIFETPPLACGSLSNKKLFYALKFYLIYTFYSTLQLF